MATITETVQVQQGQSRSQQDDRLDLKPVDYLKLGPFLQASGAFVQDLVVGPGVPVFYLFTPEQDAPVNTVFAVPGVVAGSKKYYRENEIYVLPPLQELRRTNPHMSRQIQIAINVFAYETGAGSKSGKPLFTQQTPLAEMQTIMWPVHLDTNEGQLAPGAVLVVPAHFISDKRGQRAAHNDAGRVHATINLKTDWAFDSEGLRLVHVPTATANQYESVMAYADKTKTVQLVLKEAQRMPKAVHKQWTRDTFTLLRYTYARAYQAAMEDTDRAKKTVSPSHPVSSAMSQQNLGIQLTLFIHLLEQLLSAPALHVFVPVKHMLVDAAHPFWALVSPVVPMSAPPEVLLETEAVPTFPELTVQLLLAIEIVSDRIEQNRHDNVISAIAENAHIPATTERATPAATIRDQAAAAAEARQGCTRQPLSQALLFATPAPTPVGVAGRGGKSDEDCFCFEPKKDVFLEKIELATYVGGALAIIADRARISRGLVLGSEEFNTIVLALVRSDEFQNSVDSLAIPVPLWDRVKKLWGGGPKQPTGSQQMFSSLWDLSEAELLQELENCAATGYRLTADLINEQQALPMERELVTTREMRARFHSVREKFLDPVPDEAVQIKRVGILMLVLQALDSLKTENEVRESYVKLTTAARQQLEAEQRPGSYLLNLLHNRLQPQTLNRVLMLATDIEFAGYKMLGVAGIGWGRSVFSTVHEPLRRAWNWLRGHRNDPDTLGNIGRLQRLGRTTLTLGLSVAVYYFLEHAVLQGYQATLNEDLYNARGNYLQWAVLRSSLLTGAALTTKRMGQAGLMRLGEALPDFVWAGAQRTWGVVQMAGHSVRAYMHFSLAAANAYHAYSHDLFSDLDPNASSETSPVDQTIRLIRLRQYLQSAAEIGENWQQGMVSLYTVRTIANSSYSTAEVLQKPTLGTTIMVPAFAGDCDPILWAEPDDPITANEQVQNVTDSQVVLTIKAELKGDKCAPYPISHYFTLLGKEIEEIEKRNTTLQAYKDCLAAYNLTAAVGRGHKHILTKEQEDTVWLAVTESYYSSVPVQTAIVLANLGDALPDNHTETGYLEKLGVGAKKLFFGDPVPSKFNPVMELFQCALLRGSCSRVLTEEDLHHSSLQIYNRSWTKDSPDRPVTRPAWNQTLMTGEVIPNLGLELFVQRDSIHTGKVRSVDFGAVSGGEMILTKCIKDLGSVYNMFGGGYDETTADRALLDMCMQITDTALRMGTNIANAKDFAQNLTNTLVTKNTNEPNMWSVGDIVPGRNGAKCRSVRIDNSAYGRYECCIPAEQSVELLQNVTSDADSVLRSAKQLESSGRKYCQVNLGSLMTSANSIMQEAPQVRAHKAHRMATDLLGSTLGGTVAILSNEASKLTPIRQIGMAQLLLQASALKGQSTGQRIQTIYDTINSELNENLRAEALQSVVLLGAIAGYLSGDITTISDFQYHLDRKGATTSYSLLERWTYKQAMRITGLAVGAGVFVAAVGLPAFVTSLVGAATINYGAKLLDVKSIFGSPVTIAVDMIGTYYKPKIVDNPLVNVVIDTHLRLRSLTLASDITGLHLQAAQTLGAVFTESDRNNWMRHSPFIWSEPLGSLNRERQFWQRTIRTSRRISHLCDTVRWFFTAAGPLEIAAEAVATRSSTTGTPDYLKMGWGDIFTYVRSDRIISRKVADAYLGGLAICIIATSQPNYDHLVSAAPESFPSAGTIGYAYGCSLLAYTYMFVAGGSLPHILLRLFHKLNSGYMAGLQGFGIALDFMPVVNILCHAAVFALPAYILSYFGLLGLLSITATCAGTGVAYAKFRVQNDISSLRLYSSSIQLVDTLQAERVRSHLIYIMYRLPAYQELSPQTAVPKVEPRLVRLEGPYAKDAVNQVICLALALATAVRQAASMESGVDAMSNLAADRIVGPVWERIFKAGASKGHPLERMLPMIRYIIECTIGGTFGVGQVNSDCPSECHRLIIPYISHQDVRSWGRKAAHMTGMIVSALTAAVIASDVYQYQNDPMTTGTMLEYLLGSSTTVLTVAGISALAGIGLMTDRYRSVVIAPFVTWQPPDMHHVPPKYIQTVDELRQYFAWSRLDTKPKLASKVYDEEKLPLRPNVKTLEQYLPDRDLFLDLIGYCNVANSNESFYTTLRLISVVISSDGEQMLQYLSVVYNRDPKMSGIVLRHLCLNLFAPSFSQADSRAMNEANECEETTKVYGKHTCSRTKRAAEDKLRAGARQAPLSLFGRMSAGLGSGVKRITNSILGESAAAADTEASSRSSVVEEAAAALAEADALLNGLILSSDDDDD